MHTLICGSMAYDTIMVFPDRFKNHLLADQLHILNVCFLAPEMRREFGGTAGNIAYKLLMRIGEAETIGPILMGMSKPVHVLQRGCQVEDIVNIAAVAVVDAQEAETRGPFVKRNAAAAD